MLRPTRYREVVLTLFRENYLNQRILKSVLLTLWKHFERDSV